MRSICAQYAQHASSSNHFTFGQSTHLESGSFAWLIMGRYFGGNIQKVTKPVRSDVKCDNMCVMTLASGLCVAQPT
jgi:hypothetical protein